MKVIFLVFLFLSSIIFGQSPTYNEEFQVNSYTNDDQNNPCVVGLSNGNFVICWTSNFQDGINEGIFAQLYSEDGQKIGSEFQVNTFTTYGQRNPSISNLSNNTFVICWESEEQDGSWSSIFAQIFDYNGVKIGSEFPVNTYINDAQGYPSLSSLTNGNFVVSWMSYDQDGSMYGIYAQLFDQHGNKISNEIQVNTYTESQQYWPTTVGLSNGGFGVSWSSNGQEGNSHGIFAQLFNDNAEKINDEFRVNSFNQDDQSVPAFAKLHDNKFILCWMSDADLNPGIFAKIFDGGNITETDDLQINTNTPELTSAPTVVKLEKGGFIVCWENHYSGNCEIFAQLFDDIGNKIGTEFQVNNYSESWQFNPSVSTFSEEKIIVCWDSYNQDGSGNGVFAKYYLAGPINHNLIPFNLISPTISGAPPFYNVKFSWHQASTIRVNFPWELTYDLIIDTTIAFSSPLVIGSIQDTTYQIDSLAANHTYFWKVLAKTYHGDSLWSSESYNFFVDQNTVVENKETDSNFPRDFGLHQNYPNPFNPTTTIKFNIPANVGNENFRSLLKVYDVLGNEITTLVNEQKTPGAYEVEFSAEDFSLTSGIYFYKLTIGQFSDTRKMLLIK